MERKFEVTLPEEMVGHLGETQEEIVAKMITIVTMRLLIERRLTDEMAALILRKSKEELGGLKVHYNAPLNTDEFFELVRKNRLEIPDDLPSVMPDPSIPKFGVCRLMP